MRRRFLLGILLCSWMLAVGAGFSILLGHGSKSGDPGSPLEKRPSGSRLSFDAERPTLLIFLHPHCPCSCASLEELNRIVALCGDRLSALRRHGPTRGSVGRLERHRAARRSPCNSRSEVGPRSRGDRGAPIRRENFGARHGVRSSRSAPLQRRDYPLSRIKETTPAERPLSISSFTTEPKRLGRRSSVVLCSPSPRLPNKRPTRRNLDRTHRNRAETSHEKTNRRNEPRRRGQFARASSFRPNAARIIQTR